MIMIATATTTTNLCHISTLRIIQVVWVGIWNVCLTWLDCWLFPKIWMMMTIVMIMMNPLIRLLMVYAHLSMNSAYSLYSRLLPMVSGYEKSEMFVRHFLCKPFLFILIMCRIYIFFIMCLVFWVCSSLILWKMQSIISVVHNRIDKQDKMKNINRQGNKLWRKIGCLDLHLSKFFSYLLCQS